MYSIECNINDGCYPLYKYEEYILPKFPSGCFTGDIPCYYLDNSTKCYNHCYKTCNTCNFKGDEIINNCTSCKGEYV